MAADTQAGLGRRSLLKKGLFGGLLLLLGGGTALAYFPSRDGFDAPLQLLSLSAGRFQVLAAIALRIAPPGKDGAAVALGVDRILSYAAVEVRQDFEKLLGLFENALPGLLLDGRALPFTRLSEAGQDEVLESWRTSKLTLRRSGYQALRKLCLMAYWTQESAWAAIGYDPPSGLNASAMDDSKLGTPEWVAAQAAAAAPAAAAAEAGAPSPPAKETP
jgi:hypothetical protein